MLKNNKRSSSFIIGSRHAGRSYLVSIKCYSVILQHNISGEMSDAHRKALKVILDSCDIPWESWINLTELIEQNKDEDVIEILGQVDDTGQSYLERDFINKSIAALEIAQRESNSILEQAQQLTEEQKLYLESIHKNCGREIEIWKDIALYYS